MSDRHADHYILFLVADTTYGLPSRDVAHVELVENVTRVPNAAPFVDGIVFSRGQVVPAVNMRARFGFERQPHDVRTRLVVVRWQGRAVGLLVDSCREFMTIPAESITTPGDAVPNVAARYLSGIATSNDRLIVILNLEALLATTDAVSADLELPSGH